MQSRTRLFYSTRWLRLVLGSLMAFATLSGLAGAPARAGTTSYTGQAAAAVPPGDGHDWFDARNWSAGVPGASDTAVIQGFNVNLSASVTVGVLILRNSSLSTTTGLAQPVTVTINSDFQWIGGGIGVNLNLPAGSTTEISGPNNKNMANNLTFNEAGVSTFTGAGSLALDGDTINNSGTFNFETDSEIENGAATPPSMFKNIGTINRNTTTGSMILATAVNNSGAINVQTGTLDLTQGGGGGGSFNVSGGAVLDFGSSPYTLTSGATLSGDGSLLLGSEFFAGELIAANGATINENIANLQLNGGRLTASGTGTPVGTLNINSTTFNWTAGILQGAGTINIGTGVTTNISGATNKQLSVVTLNNAGTINWSGAGAIAGAFEGGTVGNSVNFNNTGMFNIQNDQKYNPTGVINNSGVITKSVTGGTTVLQNLNNSGTVNVQTGELDLQTSNASLVDSGAFNVSQGAVLNLGSGGNTLTNGAVLQGDGTLRLNSEFFAGSLTVAKDATVTDTIATLQLDSGTALVAIGTLNIGATTFNWTNGTLNGPGTINLAKTVTTNLSGADAKTLGAVTLNNAGTLNWTGTGNIGVDPSAVFNNSGTFIIQNDARFSPGVNSVFTNSGVITKSGGAGNTSIETTLFANSGMVNVSSGTLSFNSVYTQTAGVTNLNGGTLSPGTMTMTGGSLVGTGTLAGNLVNGGALSPGSSNAAGVLMITGTYTQQPSGALNIKIGGTTAGASSDEVLVAGTAMLNGTLNLSLVNNFVPNNVPPFVIMGYQSEAGTFSTINKPAAINQMALGVQVNPTNVTVGPQSLGPLAIFPMGISLVSLPFDYSSTDTDAAALFGLTAMPGGFASIAIYDPATNKYLIYPNLPGDNGKQTMPGRGYWIFEESPFDFNLPGASVSSPFSETLQPGWNMLGDPFSNPVSTDDLQITDPVAVGSVPANTPQTISQAIRSGIIGSPFWSWDNANNQYVSQDPTMATLQPYVGYWLFINSQPTGDQGVTLTFTDPGP